MSDHTDALDTTISVECPVCYVDIPLPHTDEPTAEGLSVTFDRTIAEEHIQMHSKCTCRWEVLHSTPRVTRCITHGSCEVHA